MFRTIAVGTDGTETAGVAVEVALDIARRYDARLLIFSAYTPVSDKELAKEHADLPEELQWSISARERVDAILDRALHQAREHGLESDAVARAGDPATVVCGLAAEYEVDLLVVGNKGMQRRVFGSVPRAICQHAPCSVVVAKTT